ncbi:MAG: glutamyl-tRNA reductase [SAR86 cluster bacterium]|uniref:Glutamyl-tRNA reductase n=1 Tax=SAR86 cluster bacterium TaxID=2030880 RepID=A0A520MTN8_9GAMM|nr:MAG: glutamyl-tRNA reductase [SAR86 cluster bacterium]|tara:strand:- start:1343 stop:2509 length:1167 start_codon:yes stop_codon:yes gene_type:complete
MEFHCWGISHKSTSLEVREKFAFNKEKIDEIIANLKGITPFDNGVFLSTCNRTEFYSFCKRTEIKNFDSFLEGLTGRDINLRKNDQYLLSNNDAFKHLLRVMTGIDSMIVGEPDIFGQVKKSFQNSKIFNYLDSELEVIFSRAINLTKEIRSDTQLSKNPLSIASLVENKIIETEQKPVLIIGAGDVGKALIKRLNEKGYSISLYNRSDIVVEGIKSKSLELVKQDIKGFEIVVVAAASENSFFNNNDIGTNDCLIFDLAIPRNLPQELKNCNNLSILTLDELSGMVSKNLKGRKIAVKEAEELISVNCDQEFAKLRNRKNINSVQKKFHEEQSAIKEKAVDKALKKLLKTNNVEGVVKELADEIASKNAFHVSKILDESLGGKNRGS